LSATGIKNIDIADHAIDVLLLPTILDMLEEEIEFLHPDRHLVLVGFWLWSRFRSGRWRWLIWWLWLSRFLDATAQIVNCLGEALVNLVPALKESAETRSSRAVWLRDLEKFGPDVGFDVEDVVSHLGPCLVIAGIKAEPKRSSNGIILDGNGLLGKFQRCLELV